MPALAALTVLCLIASQALAQEPGLVAHYSFEEGAGDVVRDHSGQGHDGRIHGARYVRCGQGWALRFDGEDDYVDCGSPEGLKLREAVSLEAWVYPEAVPASGEPGLVGKDYGSYVLTYYTDGYCWWYISGGGNNCRAPLSTGAWHHVVGTFDGHTLRLYVDGQLEGTKASAADAIGDGGSFLLGTSRGDEQFTKGAHFRGMVDDVRVYARALSAAEVLEHYRTTHRTGVPEVSWRLAPFDETLAVRVSLRGLDRPPGTATVAVSLRRRDEDKALFTTRTEVAQDSDTALARVALPGLKPGGYELSVQASAGGRNLGEVAMESITWPEKPRWPGMAPEARVLNCLVTELLAVRGKAAQQVSQRFINPRKGWVFLRGRATGARGGQVTVALESAERPEVLLTLTPGEAPAEAMRLLGEGAHQLTVLAERGARPEELEVRAVPELTFSQFGAHPHVKEYGLYDWDFLSRYVLPHANTIVGGGSEEDRPYVERWRGEGKRWILHCSVPGLGEGKTVTADEAEKYWTETRGMADPLYDGAIADEFFAQSDEKYQAWTEALRRMQANPALAGKVFYAYCCPIYGEAASREFARTLVAGGSPIALERYLSEPASEEAARACLQSALTEQLAAWQEALPGVEQDMVIVLGYMSQPPESLNTDPGVDLKVFMDMQFHLLANDPTFFGLYGVMEYLSSYADEETVRWAGQLFRHYCIEGERERLTRDPYVLPHLTNPDFAEGLEGWEVHEAEPGAARVGQRDGLSWLQGRYPPTGKGNQFLALKRSAAGPNTVSQTVRGLEPGRLYSLKLYVAEPEHLEVQQKLALRASVEGVEALPDTAFVHVFPNCYSHHHGPFNAENRAWMNYHWQVFRARGREARLVLSDWASDTEPGGPVGQELAVNFVEIQPYLPR